MFHSILFLTWFISSTRLSPALAKLTWLKLIIQWDSLFFFSFQPKKVKQVPSCVSYEVKSNGGYPTACYFYVKCSHMPSISHFPKVKLGLGQIRSIGVQVYLHYGYDLYLTNDIARHASRSTELTQIKFRWWVFVSVRLKRLSARITSWWMCLYSKWWYTWAFLLKSWNKLLWFFLQLVLVRCCWDEY